LFLLFSIVHVIKFQYTHAMNIHLQSIS
jgi:hypothetical protein